MWVGVTAGVSKLILMAIMPITKHMDLEDEFLLERETKEIMKKHHNWENFQAGNIHCPCCKETLTFTNLGGVKESKEKLELICNNPGCAIKQ